jgi:putative oxygen-independent coproporphyrinogen III oxidase
VHLYFHVPFCARRCSYCDFAIAVRRNVPSERYVNAVLREWSWRRGHPAWDISATVDTLYFGGGTPSRLDPAALARIIDRIASEREIAAGAEVTLEANPEDVTPAAAAAWRAAGVNRVSLGVQSFDPAVLQWMHRTHSAEQVPAAVDALRTAGIGDVSLDLIFGLPNDLHRRWGDDLARALELRPTHLSLYGLTVEAGTPLGRWTERGEVRPVDEDLYAAEFLMADAVLRRAGFQHYEVSNYALPDHRARHNSAYWSRAPYLGLGPSAHSGWAGERQWNLREWEAYLAAAEQGAEPVAGHEQLDPEAIAIEELYLALRTSDGLPADRIPLEDRERWTGAGWAVVAGGRLRLTPEGWLRLDALVAGLTRYRVGA